MLHAFREVSGKDAAARIYGERGSTGLGRVGMLVRKGKILFAGLRFLWNATRGHRLAPWRSQYLRWRIETFSGKRAETLDAKSVMGFVWEQKWELLRFLVWTGQVEQEAKVKRRRKEEPVERSGGTLGLGLRGRD